MGYRDVLNRFPTTPIGGWILRNIARHLDPVLYRWSGGRLTSLGPQWVPQILLTTTGRRTGLPRTLQLVYTLDGEDFILVATNYGQPHHPGWSYNLDAKPEAEIQHNREKFRVNVTRLSDAEKAEIWPRLCENVPPYAVYVTRTERNIRVYRLRRAA